MVWSLRMVFALAYDMIGHWKRKSLKCLALPFPRERKMFSTTYDDISCFLSRKRCTERWLIPTLLLPQCEDLRRYLMMITGWFGSFLPVRTFQYIRCLGRYWDRSYDGCQVWHRFIWNVRFYSIWQKNVVKRSVWFVVTLRALTNYSALDAQLTMIRLLGCLIWSLWGYHGSLSVKHMLGHICRKKSAECFSENR
jgi:hypothetical protein